MSDYEAAMGGSVKPGLFDNINGLTIFYMVFLLAISIINLIALIKLFKKFGYKGWEAIVPIYNLIILAKIGNKKAYYIFLYIINPINLIFFYLTYKNMCEKLKLDKKYAILLTIFPFIMLPYIAFNKNINCSEEYMVKDEKLVVENMQNVTDVNELLNQNNNDVNILNNSVTNDALANNMSNENINNTQSMPTAQGEFTNFKEAPVNNEVEKNVTPVVSNDVNNNVIDEPVQTVVNNTNPNVISNTPLNNNQDNLVGSLDNLNEQNMIIDPNTGMMMDDSKENVNSNNMTGM